MAVLDRPNIYETRVAESGAQAATPDITVGSTTTIVAASWPIDGTIDTGLLQMGVISFSGVIADPMSHAQLAQAFRQRPPVRDEPDGVLPLPDDLD